MTARWERAYRAPAIASALNTSKPSSEAMPRISSLLLNIALTFPTFINAENPAQSDHRYENCFVLAGGPRFNHHDVAAALVGLRDQDVLATVGHSQPGIAGNDRFGNLGERRDSASRQLQ